MRLSKIPIALIVVLGCVRCGNEHAHPPFLDTSCTMQPCGVNGYHGNGGPGGQAEAGASDAGDAGSAVDAARD